MSYESLLCPRPFTCTAETLATPEHIDAIETARLIGTVPIVDVRTSDEYDRGHLPTALNYPLFSSDERAEIGTTYKQVGRVEATQLGLRHVGPRIAAMLDTFLSDLAPGRVVVHCWRGGMRSESVGWLLRLSSRFEPLLLEGGYKAYRRFALGEFAKARRLILIGGMTGSRKTRILREIKALGGQTIDLESLASHKGSAFGAIGQPSPPTQQQFENDLALELSRADTSQVLWLEDESRHIGRRNLPDDLWEQMRSADVIFLHRSRTERVEHLLNEYGSADSAVLIGSLAKIERRLGGALTAEAADAVRRGALHEACNIVLDYYDRTYNYGLEQRDPDKVRQIDVSGRSDREVALMLVESS